MNTVLIGYEWDAIVGEMWCNGADKIRLRIYNIVCKCTHLVFCVGNLISNCATDLSTQRYSLFLKCGLPWLSKCTQQNLCLLNPKQRFGKCHNCGTWIFWVNCSHSVGRIGAKWGCQLYRHTLSELTRTPSGFYNLSEFAFVYLIIWSFGQMVAWRYLYFGPWQNTVCLLPTTCSPPFQPFVWDELETEEPWGAIVTSSTERWLCCILHTLGHGANCKWGNSFSVFQSFI